MLVKLNLSNKARFSYKIKSETAHKNNKTFFIVTAPHPRNTRQKNKLIEFLAPYEKQIIYPHNFNHSEYPAAYPAFDIYCKKLLLNFLNKCKKTRPRIAVITPNGVIKEDFYFDLSEYVGKIILNTKNAEDGLKAALLAHSGTVLEFGTDYNKNQKGIEYLSMPKKESFFTTDYI